MNVVEQYMFSQRHLTSTSFFSFHDNLLFSCDSERATAELNCFLPEDKYLTVSLSWENLIGVNFFNWEEEDKHTYFKRILEESKDFVTEKEIKVSLHEYYSRYIEDSFSFDTLKESIEKAPVEELPSGDLGSLVYLGSMTSLFYHDHRPLELSDWYKHHVLVFLNTLNSSANYLGGTLVSPDNFQEDLFIQVVQGETPSLG